MKRTFVVALAALSLSALGFAPSVFATIPPTLNLTATGTGDNVLINIAGDPNASVLLSYSEAGSGPQIASLGTTDSNGNFSSTVSSATYGLTSGTPVTVILDGTSGPRSPTLDWPTVISANSLTLSQSAVVVNVGTSATLSATNAGSASLYVSNNSNPSIANVNVSDSQVTISGNTQGSTTVTLCTVGNTSNCPSVYITVEPAGEGQLSLSQTSATVVSGQSLPITISGGSGVYEVFNNANASLIQASISGSVLTLTTGATSGTDSITVCSSDLSLCGVVVATAGNASSAGVSFSTTAPVVSTGASETVNIYGPSGVQFYVSSNSTPSVVQANLSGTTLTLAGIAAGTSSIAVCASTGACATLPVTVQYTSSGNIAISQTTVSLVPGQNLTITVSGGEQPYSVSGGITSVAQESLNGSTLTVYGVAGGTSSLSVCSAGGGCVPLTITVSGTPAPLTTSTVPTTTTVVPSVMPATPAYSFTEYLAPGDQDAQVLQLQNVLAAEGDFSGTATGYFGTETENAVIAFQAAHALDQLGVVGPATRAALNQIETAGGSTSNVAISSMSLTQLQSEVASLESALNQVLSRITQLSGQ